MLSGVNIGLMALSGSAKRAYHHGDLRNALIEAAAELAAQGGGPGSVTIRAAARLVGVTPTAAYRHFAGHEELLDAATERASEELAAAMRRELDARPRLDDPVQHALGSLAALGRGYLAFAKAQPGLFRTLFSGDKPIHDPGAGADPFAHLLAALDELVAVGYLSVERRALAEVATWSMVHGLAVLLDGPLCDMPEDVRAEAVERAVLILANGLAGTGLTPEQEAMLSGEMRSVA
jgi:AcrR family transcriptional regulator